MTMNQYIPFNLINREELELFKLKGEFKHQCYDWDGLAIDEFCPEFESCLCFKDYERLPYTWIKDKSARSGPTDNL